MNTQQKILTSMICISIEPHVWAGRRKLRPDDLKIRDGEIPPSDLASLGSLKVCDPEHLRTFDTLRKRAQAICFKRGVRFLGGYAIPKADFNDVAAELDQVAKEFDDAKVGFLADYNQTIEKWVQQHPGWEAIVRRSVVPSEKVAAGISFDWTPIPIGASVEEDSKVTERVLSKVSGLRGQLLEEISAEALKVEEKLIGVEKIGQSSLNSLKRMRSKLTGLSFLDSSIGPIASMIDAVLASVPAAGVVDGMGLASVHGLLYLLSTPERMMEHSAKILAGRKASEVVAESISARAPQATATEDEVERKNIVAPVTVSAAADDDAIPIAPVPARPKVHPVSVFF